MNTYMMHITLAMVLIAAGVLCSGTAIFRPNWFAEFERARGTYSSEYGRVLYIMHAAAFIAFGILVLSMNFK